MRPRCWAALTAAVFLLAACEPETEQILTPEAEPAHVWAQSLVPWGLRGAVAIVEHGDTTVSAGFGALTPGGAGTIGTGTRMALGSLTKPVTALAVWRLADQGRVALDQTLGDLLPEVTGAKAAITVEQLMSHTAGLADTHGADEEQIDRAEALRRILAQPLLFEPGTDESYSNSGYTLLAMIIEKASGLGYEDYLTSEIFDPAGMSGTGFHAEPPPAGREEAPGSSAEGPAGAPSQLPPVSWSLRGAGGLVSTVDDLVALDRSLFTGPLLSPPTRELALESSLGELLPGIEAIAAAGGTPAIHHSSMWLAVPDRDLTVVVLSADRRVLAEDVVDRLARALLSGEDLPSPPPTVAPDPAADAALAGTYRADTGATITVAAHPEGIRLTTDHAEAFGDLFTATSPPGLATPEETLRLVEGLTDDEYRNWLTARETEFGPLDHVELLGAAPVDSPEPATFLRHHFARGTALTFWAVSSPHGEVMSVELAAAPPGVTFHRAAGGHVSFSVVGTPVASLVTFDGTTMTVHNGDRTSTYRR
ncbi:serine hydrolase domain-containing protein [Phytomonospora sp. NPDC050363]|uniref:serine hydrolase domain-containing protein n=1 Tax=Phytomonospora sp. NPDC050363 TaxID=3155642 RepID=UPI0033E9108B